MTALMVDRFFAVHLGLKYFTWKTTKKAKIAVFLMWLVCTIVMVLLAVPLFNMDLDGMPVATSRKVIFEKRGLIVASVIVLFTIASSVLGILTCCSIYQKKKERMLLNLPPLCAEARLKMDIKATKTVAMTVALYYICYIPTIVFSIWRHNEEDRVFNAWFAFIVTFCTFLSSALNPIIYVARNRRNRSALRQLLKNPCGTSAYRENPVRKEQEAGQRAKKPQIEGGGLKDGRDTGASVRPGSNPENRKEKEAKQREMEPQMEGEELKDGRDAGASVRPGSNPENRKEKEAKQREMEQQMEGEELKDGRDTAASLRPGPNPESDTRQPTVAKHQIYQSRRVVKIAWEKNHQEDSGRPNEQVAVSRQDRRDVRSSGSVRDNRKKMKMRRARRKGIIGTSPEAKVSPCSLSPP
ncbi:hypothetical protein ACROYT_G044059 [Oculina patagonica]